ncbi:GDH/6PGL endoplasmic bifunctional protein-like [Paramacrobiotus metropolitanus]|uniref:GDH/6PGL endoplasmic bifunctional protein-like n=1 Tax=Paramacrobiotus metropolitanus TaxID=2943436 RepID=UPI002445DB24|nr:GDH/6PGL endoplasmic bifunctional protein-like [Paramacrobiotus metropolitanus]
MRLEAKDASLLLISLTVAASCILLGLYLRAQPDPEPSKNALDEESIDFILLGATGDLSLRYVLPALHHFLPTFPAPFTLYLASRQEPHELHDHLHVKLQKGKELLEKAVVLRLKDDDDYARFCASPDKGTRRIFYLSIPPAAYAETVRLIARHCGAGVRIVLEKPFGLDHATALQLFSVLHMFVQRDAFYLVDHYKAKEAVLAIPHFFHLNPHLRPLLQPPHLQRLDVVMNETEDVAQRLAFFEEVGVIRDVVQNHLMEILTDLLIESGRFPSKPAILSQLAVTRLHTEQYSTYIQEAAAHHRRPDYRSPTATFIQAEMTLAPWDGVRIVVSAGKKLARKISMARIILDVGEVLFVTAGALEGVNYPAVMYRGELGTVLCPLGEAGRVRVRLEEETDYWVCPLGSGFRNAYEAVIRDVCGRQWSAAVQFEFILHSWRLWDPWTGAQTPSGG